MERKNVADTVSGFLFSVQLQLSLLFFVRWIFGCSEEEILSSLIWIFFCVKHKQFLIQQFLIHTTAFDTYNSFWYKVNFRNKPKQRKPKSSSVGFEPSTSGLEVQRTIRCATRSSGISECQLQRVSGIGMKALCTCFSYSSWLIQTDRIKTPYHFLSLRSLARRLCRAVVNPVVLLACELQFSFLELLCLMLLFLF